MTNLITNGDFATDLASWNYGGINWSWNTGKARRAPLSSGVLDGYMYQAINCVAGFQYLLSFDASNTGAGGSGNIGVIINGQVQFISASDTTFTINFTAQSSTVNIIFFGTNNGSFTYDIDNISVDLILDISQLFIYPNISSDWLAAHSPIIITTVRKDFSVSTTQNDGTGKVKINISGSPPATITGYIYVNSEGVVGVYKVLSSASGYVIIDLDWVADTTGGWINLNNTYDKWRIVTTVYKRNSSGTFDKFATSINYSDPSGLVSIDVSNAASRSVSFKDDFDYTTINIRDENNTSALRFRHSILFQSSGTTVEDDLDDDEVILYFTNAAMQLQHAYGSNVTEFVPIDPTVPARWLIASDAGAKLKRVKYWNGMPFDVSFIIPDGIDTTLTLRSNNGATALSSPLSIAGNDKYVHRINVGLHLTSSAEKIQTDVWIENSGGDTISEVMKVRVTSRCKNPQYLKWIGSTGGWNYFMFEELQTWDWSTSTDGLFSKYITELSSADTDSDFINSRNIPERTYGAEQLDIFDTVLMWSLIESPKVMQLINIDSWQSEGAKWQTVKINRGTTRVLETDKVFNKIEFKLKMVETQLQSL